MIEPESQVIDEAGIKIAADLAALLDDAPLPGDPAGLEMLAATLLVPLLQRDLPLEVPVAVISEFEHRGDADAAALLGAMAVVSGEPIAGRALAAAERLAGSGIVARPVRRLGTLAPTEAMRVHGGDAELLIVLLRRPGLRTLQMAVLGIELEDSGGALVECMLTPPMRSADARALLHGDELANERREPISAAELTQRLASAAQRTVDLGGALGSEAAIALPLIARALTGDPQGFGRPEIAAPWEEDDDELTVDAAEDEQGFHELMEILLGEFEAFARSVYEPGSCIWRHGDFVAGCMLEWKGGYDDGRLGRWTEEDLEELLLGYFPRKVSMSDADSLDAVPDCVRAFLCFLDDRGSLSGMPLERLEQTCEELREEFLDQAQSPAAWGLAKSMAMQMLAEGIDPERPGAMEAWMADFNARPIEERDAIIGGAADRMFAAASPPPDPAPKARAAPARRARRRMQRSARKRNHR